MGEEPLAGPPDPFGGVSGRPVPSQSDSGVQTFLPYADFERTARALDDRRLGKQRVEALQILRALTRERYGWKNHPAVRMWAGYEEALASYGVAVCREWCRRGHADTCEAKIVDDFRSAGLGAAVRPAVDLAGLGLLPPWLGRRSFHRSHRSALVRKDPGFYRARFPRVPDDLPYVWPSPAGATPPLRAGGGGPASPPGPSRRAGGA